MQAWRTLKTCSIIAAGAFFLSPAHAQDRLACSAPDFLLTHREAHTAADIPRLSYLLNEQGDTTLNVLIGGNGAVKDASVFISSGYRRLDEAAIATVKNNWHWDSFTGPCSATGVATKVKIGWHWINHGSISQFHTIFADVADYPTEARARKEEGVAVVAVDVTPTGTATNVRLVQGTDYPDLDAKAQQIASKMSFRPATVDGEPSRSTISVQVLFSLEGPPKTATTPPG